MATLSLVLLFGASVVAGMVNALAGGGSLVTLPVLLALGLPPTAANATNAVAAWSGLVGGAWTLRGTLSHARATIGRLALVAGLGGAVGAGLMLATPRAVLAASLPWMILLATLAFLFAPLFLDRFGVGRAWNLARLDQLGLGRVAGVFAVSVATGYFNPAGGVMMITAFAALGIGDIRIANGLKIVLGMLMTGASVIVFALAGSVDWAIAGLMVVGTVVGGRIGASLAMVVDRRVLRGLVLGWGGVMSAVFMVPH